MNLILISGHARHGKDTAAKYIKYHLTMHNHRVLIAHYADILKFFCKEYLYWDGVKNERGRTLLQKVGTDFVRKKHPDLWVETLMKFLDAMQSEWDYVIIPDCRFKNEIDIPYKMFKGKCRHYKVVRNIDNGLTEEQKNHPSETDLDDYVCQIIENYLTLEDLNANCHDIAERINYVDKHRDTV